MSEEYPFEELAMEYKTPWKYKTPEERSFELFIPKQLTDEPHLVSTWVKTRGCHMWNAFNPHANYPNGIQDTKWEDIVWSYKVYLP